MPNQDLSEELPAYSPQSLPTYSPLRLTLSATYGLRSFSRNKLSFVPFGRTVATDGQSTSSYSQVVPSIRDGVDPVTSGGKLQANLNATYTVNIRNFTFFSRRADILISKDEIEASTKSTSGSKRRSAPTASIDPSSPSLQTTSESADDTLKLRQSSTTSSATFQTSSRQTSKSRSLSVSSTKFLRAVTLPWRPKARISFTPPAHLIGPSSEHRSDSTVSSTQVEEGQNSEGNEMEDKNEVDLEQSDDGTWCFIVKGREYVWTLEKQPLRVVCSERVRVVITSRHDGSLGDGGENSTSGNDQAIANTQEAGNSVTDQPARPAVESLNVNYDDMRRMPPTALQTEIHDLPSQNEDTEGRSSEQNDANPTTGNIESERPIPQDPPRRSRRRQDIRNIQVASFEFSKEGMGAKNGGFVGYLKVWREESLLPSRSRQNQHDDARDQSNGAANLRNTDNERHDKEREFERIISTLMVVLINFRNEGRWLGGLNER